MSYITVTSTVEMDSLDIREMVWSGAADRVADLTDEQLDIIIDNLNELYPEGIDKSELNDFLWFEADTYAEWLGFRDEEQMWERAGKVEGYYDFDKQVRIGFDDNLNFFITSESIEDQIGSIIDEEDDYEFIDDTDEFYDEDTDIWSGSVVIDINQSGIDKLADANINFDIVEE